MFTSKRHYECGKLLCLNISVSCVTEPCSVATKSNMRFSRQVGQQHMWYYMLEVYEFHFGVHAYYFFSYLLLRSLIFVMTRVLN